MIPENHDVPEGLKPWSNYWYISYDAHIKSNDMRYSGYDIIVLETSYFDFERAIKQLVPTYSPEDYVEIKFFQMVPVETYKAFKKSKL